MKLIRFGGIGQERPGILTEDGRRLDVGGVVADWTGSTLGPAVLDRIRALATEGLPEVAEDVRWGAPTARPGKIVCIGLNYSDHAEETGAAIPAEPIVFMKAANTVVGPYDPIEIPRGSEKTDWEAELGVVLGSTARYLKDKDSARSVIAGYVLNHDVSERAFQMERGGQWTKGKSCDSFNPMGPFLLTADELPDPHALPITLSVNGTIRQQGNTATMIFDVFTLVHYLSQFMTLEPGDLISTGTPPGVGLGMKPPQYLKVGDEVELAIEGLGRQRQRCIAARP